MKAVASHASTSSQVDQLEESEKTRQAEKQEAEYKPVVMGKTSKSFCSRFLSSCVPVGFSIPWHWDFWVRVSTGWRSLMLQDHSQLIPNLRNPPQLQVLQLASCSGRVVSMNEHYITASKVLVVWWSLDRSHTIHWRIVSFSRRNPTAADAYWSRDELQQPGTRVWSDRKLLRSHWGWSSTAVPRVWHVKIEKKSIV